MQQQSRKLQIKTKWFVNVTPPILAYETMNRVLGSALDGGSCLEQQWRQQLSLTRCSTRAMQYQRGRRFTEWVLAPIAWHHGSENVGRLFNLRNNQDRANRYPTFV